MNDRNLIIYLNNHLAGSVTGIDLVKRAISESREAELGNWLETLQSELEEDQATVKRLLREIGGTEDLVKKFGGWALEKVAEFGMPDLAGKSAPLRLVVELEGVLLGTHGRIGMWRLLELFYGADPRMTFADFNLLRRRAEEQARELERYRELEAAIAFTET